MENNSNALPAEPLKNDSEEKQKTTKQGSEASNTYGSRKAKSRKSEEKLVQEEKKTKYGRKPKKNFSATSRSSLRQEKKTEQKEQWKPEVNAKPGQPDQLNPTPPNWPYSARKEKEKNGIKEDSSQSNQEKPDLN